ncbi:hypothetical protein D030_1782A, partial [Vibrio parahaemolyticus AQ3810]
MSERWKSSKETSPKPA